MTKRLLAITISMLLIVSMFPGLVSGASVTLTLNANSSMVGDSITASGSADPNEWVSIKAVDSSGSIVFFDAVKSDASGNYSCIFKIPQVSPGTVTVVAGYGINVANKTLEIENGGPVNPTLDNITITKAANKLVYIENDLLDISGLEVTGQYSNGSTRVETITSANISGFDSSAPAAHQVLTITVGGKTTTFPVTITKLIEAGQNQTIPITAIPLTITMGNHVSGAKIAVNKDEPLPLVVVNTNTSLGMVETAIPEGTKITDAPADWDGNITLPEVKIQPGATVSNAQKVNAVIEIGLPDKEISFDRAVRLLVPGQRGKSAGFIRNGQFTEIKTTISQDVQATADRELTGNVRDGKVDAGNDLAIWTKHFTEFVAYTPSAGGSPGGGGGGSISPSSQTIGRSGGTVKAAGAVVIFPEDAVSSDIKVTVKKLSSGFPSISSGLKLLSEVYEITSDKNIEFKKPVSITLPYDRNKADHDQYDAGIYCWDNNQWVMLDQVKVETAARTVSGEVSHFSKFAVLAREKEKEPIQEVFKPTEPTLKDITGHWAKDNISKLIAAGAISGYPDGTFKPDNTISRAEFATMLVRAFKLEPKDGKIFSDTADHWAEESIAVASAYGIVNGYSDTAFGPNDNITREQMAVMIAKAAQLAGDAAGKNFADSNQISDWAKEAVNRSATDGIISGYPDNSFRPRATATRAEAVTVIVKALYNMNLL